MRANSALQPLAAVERRRWRRRRYDELDVAVVELIDERDEAARLVLVRGVEDRHAGDNHRLVLARDLDVVVLAARRRRTAPQNRTTRRSRSTPITAIGRPSISMLPPALTAVAGQLAEQRLEARGAVPASRGQVDGRLRQLAQAIVRAAGDVHHLEVALEECDGGQEALALQATLVLIRAAARWKS